MDTSFHMLMVVPANTRSPAIIARTMRAMIRPYSTAVAARLSLISFQSLRIATGPHAARSTATGNSHKGGSVKQLLPAKQMAETKATMTVVAAALADGGGRVLLQRRPAGRAMAGLWEFPGGKVEEGERPEAALVRELAEELGVAVEEAALSPAAFATAQNGDRPMLLLLYLCREWSGEPRALHADALLWAAPAEMAALAMPPADVPLVEALKRIV